MAERRASFVQFTFAFQPIVDVGVRDTIAYEALIRGRRGERPASVFGRLRRSQRLAFDAASRARAIELAKLLGITCRLSLNVPPSAVAHPEYGVLATLEAARTVGFPAERLIFEITEDEALPCPRHTLAILEACRAQGVIIALDDVGAGFNGLNMMLETGVDLIKLDMQLVAKLTSNPRARSIIAGFVAGCRAGGVDVVAEGVDRPEVARALLAIEVDKMQGWLFGRPALARLPSVDPSLFQLA